MTKIISIAHGAGKEISMIIVMKNNKEKLFIYGTLIDQEIQKEVLGRITKTIPDVLRGYEKSEIEIEGEKYPLIAPNPLGRVEGLVIEVTKDEFRRIDEYETDVYKREMIVLESGLLAWVYLKR